jgi:hypothetical protein
MKFKSITRGNYPVKIYRTNFTKEYPILGAYYMLGIWKPEKWTKEGFSSFSVKGTVPTSTDLILKK